MTGRQAGRTPWPRYTPAPSIRSVALYPRHAALAAAVAGLLAGPRSAAAVVGLTGVLLATAACCAVRRDRDGDDRTDGTDPRTPYVPASRLGALAVLAAGAVASGAVVADARSAALAAGAPHGPAPVRLVGFVEDQAKRRSFGTVVVPLRPATGPRILLRARSRLRLPATRIGDELAVRGTLRPLHTHEAFERRRGIRAVLDADSVSATGRRRDGPVDRARRRAEDAVGAGLPPEQAALARGMVLGQDGALPEDLHDAFRAAGLAHLVAASGTNVMLLAALVLGAAALLGLPLRVRLGLAVAAIAMYVPLAGSGPSIQRAGVMGVAGLVAALAGRPASRWYAVLLAAVVTLVANPRAAEDPGWQLSFAAVIAILALHRRIRTALTDRAVPVGIAEAAAMTIAATAGTAPLLSLHFGQVSLVSLPANLLAVPAVAPVMWLGAAGALVGDGLAPALNAVAAFPLGYLAWLGRAAAALPHATLGAELPGPVAATAAYAVLGLVCLVPWLLRRLPTRVRSPLVAAGVLRTGGVHAEVRVRWSTVTPALVVVAAGALLAAPGPPRPPAGPMLSLLDIGQGDAVLLQDGPRAMLVDTGPAGGGLVDELREAGVRRLDAVMLTHSADDHAGALPEVLQAMPVGLVLDGRGPGLEHGGEGAGARFEGLPAGMRRAVPAAGQRLRLGSITVEVLWPPAGDRRLGEPNDTATVALARTDTTSALLTADAESHVTLALDLPRVDVLKVAHHGSADEGLPTLLERVEPRLALIPVGRNSYGHPTPETLDALRAVPVVKRTDRDGTIRVPLADARSARATATATAAASPTPSDAGLR